MLLCWEKPKNQLGFGHDRVLDSGYLGFRNTDISHIELDLDQNKAFITTGSIFQDLATRKMIFKPAWFWILTMFPGLSIVLTTQVIITTQSSTGFYRLTIQRLQII